MTYSIDNYPWTRMDCLHKKRDPRQTLYFQHKVPFMEYDNKYLCSYHLPIRQPGQFGGNSGIISTDMPYLSFLGNSLFHLLEKLSHRHKKEIWEKQLNFNSNCCDYDIRRINIHCFLKLHLQLLRREINFTLLLKFDYIDDISGENVELIVWLSRHLTVEPGTLVYKCQQVSVQIAQFHN